MLQYFAAVLSRLNILASKLYDYLERQWHHRATHKRISQYLVITFLAGLFINEIIRLDLLPFELRDDRVHSPFFALEFAFSNLLFAEMVSLVFVLPKSMADSVGKQFEVLSLILLRNTFKELGALPETGDWEHFTEPMYAMISDTFGALLLFVLLGIYYKNQKHIRLTETDVEQKKFIGYKKIIALFLLGAFIYLGIMDIVHLVVTGVYSSSFQIFYNVMIFCDVLVLVVALRYTMDYYRLFRYSAFIVSTVLIRLSLSAPVFLNTILGIVAILVAISVTLAYNRFLTVWNGEVLPDSTISEQ